MDPTLAGRTLQVATEITTAALSGDDPDAVLPLVVRGAAELAAAHLCLVSVRGEDDRLTVEAAHGGTNPVGIVLSARSAAARVARSGIPVVVDDLTSNPVTAPFVPPQLRIYGPFAVVPFGTRERRLGALAVYRRRGHVPFTATDIEMLTAFAAQAGLALVLAEGWTARQRLAVYEERERIARDLHDVIIQRLYAAGVQLDLLDRRLAGKLTDQEAQRLADAVDQLDQTIAEVRGHVRALRSGDPSDTSTATDLLESARSEVNTAGELLGFQPELLIEGDMVDVPVAVADNARAALREALSNVVRHSGASAVTVELQRGEHGLRLRVVDDGCGIPPDVTRRGLRHLEERATSVGGRCVVDSSARSGTTVVWEVPVG
ncbi:signal transduction histidine kinase [Kutzneria viridogrisea]|nr:GAF domain-containing protein [Kutzneria albida]MBA8929109.1 signal transduction histidine kinase [Kutzneria viridogrisea]